MRLEIVMLRNGEFFRGEMKGIIKPYYIEPSYRCIVKVHDFDKLKKDAPFFKPLKRYIEEKITHPRMFPVAFTDDAAKTIKDFLGGTIIWIDETKSRQTDRSYDES